MSTYLSFDGGEPEDFASNTGYGDLCRWSAGLDMVAFAQLAHLCEHGWCQRPDALAAELGRALAESPPRDAPTLAVAKSLAESLAGRTVDVLMVTQG
jgi:hypothetical protein